MKTRSLTLVFLLIAAFSFAEVPFKCTVKGTVNGRDSKTLFLIKASDAREEVRQPIAITNGAFQYTFDVKVTEAYELVFQDEIDNGSWIPVIFFPVKGGVTFELYPQQDSEKDKVAGGELNANFQAFKLSQKTTFNSRWDVIREKQQVLQKNKDYYIPLRDSLVNIMMHTSHEKVDRSVYLKLNELAKSGDEFTPNAKLVKVERDALQADVMKWRYNYINTHIDVVSYYLILQDAYTAKSNMALALMIKDAFPKFAEKYSDHPYTEKIGNELNAVFKIKVGEPIIDFTAADLTGKKHKLSDLSKGKITLIDMWGSWCGPCIAATRTMIPVYDEFKNKGFTMIGVAREFKTTDALKIALKREKYKWTNLVELNDQNKIWNKYGISAATGLMVLADKDGKIIAVDPTAEEVRKVLMSSL